MIKNKKNGFTLVELIATITLLAILSLMILLNMVGLKTTEENRKAERFQKNVEEAACAYIDLMDNTTMRNNCKNNSNGCTVYLSTLIDNSVALIDSESIDPYTNKLVTDEKDCVYVRIKWLNNNGFKQKQCELQRGEGCQ